MSASPGLSPRNDPQIKARLREFLETDNVTNFFYIARAWFFSFAAAAAVIAGFEWSRSAGFSLWWIAPVYLAAILVIGASQHQLAGAGHEATHHILFKNRLLNELAGDWLCMFPLFTSVHQFRLYHLAHHQYVNDPERDPDFAVLKRSGLWFNFPISKRTFLRRIARQFLFFDLLRYLVVRIRYNTTGMHETSPYRSGKRGGRLASGLLLAQFGIVIGTVTVNGTWNEPRMLLAIPGGTWLALSVAYLMLPDSAFQHTRIRPVIPVRVALISQTAYLTFVLAGLGYAEAVTGTPFLRWFAALWIVAALTTFPFFMVLRQVIQHGNGDRGWLSNTRVFRMSASVRYAIFPFGMDYHLPHHMYASVPHYRLRDLHECLLDNPEYRENCLVVDNYFVPKGDNGRNPTVLEVLGPEYSRRSDEIFVDDSVLAASEMEDPIADPASKSATH